MWNICSIYKSCAVKNSTFFLDLFIYLIGCMPMCIERLVIDEDTEIKRFLMPNMEGERTFI